MRVPVGVGEKKFNYERFFKMEMSRDIAIKILRSIKFQRSLYNRQMNSHLNYNNNTYSNFYNKLVRLLCRSFN